MCGRQVSTLGGLAVLFAGACSLVFPRAGLEHYITHEAGAEAVNCGIFTRRLLEPHTLSAEEVEAVSRCMTEAHAEGRHFYFLITGPGTDSQLGWGMLMRSEGVVRFKYDSAPCGGPACNESFVMDTCSMPTQNEPIRADMDCWHRSSSDGSPGGRTRG